MLGLLQPLGIRFLVQRSVMSSFLAIMQKTEPAGPLVRCVFWRPIRTRGWPARARPRPRSPVRRRWWRGFAAASPVRCPVPVPVSGPGVCSVPGSRIPPAYGKAAVCSTFTQYADDSKTSGYSKSWTVPGAEFDWGGTSPKQ